MLCDLIRLQEPFSGDSYPYGVLPSLIMQELNWHRSIIRHPSRESRRGIRDGINTCATLTADQNNIQTKWSSMEWVWLAPFPLVVPFPYFSWHLPRYAYIFRLWMRLSWLTLLITCVAFLTPATAHLLSPSLLQHFPLHLCVSILLLGNLVDSGGAGHCESCLGWWVVSYFESAPQILQLSL